MRVAIPLFGARVAPRCLAAREMILAEVEGGRVVSRRPVRLAAANEQSLVERLVEVEARLLVCGGIRRELKEDLAACGVEVIDNVAGEASEVLSTLCAGALASGYGLDGSPGTGPGRRESGPVEPPAPLPQVDCIACLARSCLDGGECRRELTPPPGLDALESRLFEAARDVSEESDPRLCRIAELVHFGLEMDLRRIGLAFCREMFREIEVLVPLLTRFFDVVPVCCRVGASEACNPALQASVLEHANTDLNVIAGLCLGSDLIFTLRSHAPVTTLFVRDRTLAHNPVGAIYTRYHLDQMRPGVDRRHPFGYSDQQR
jgi:uncharacterized metal-binding protein/predicted Fe-Mo cluster-binding NifX family protein